MTICLFERSREQLLTSYEASSVPHKGDVITLIIGKDSEGKPARKVTFAVEVVSWIISYGNADKGLGGYHEVEVFLHRISEDLTKIPEP